MKESLHNNMCDLLTGNCKACINKGIKGLLLTILKTMNKLQSGKVDPQILQKFFSLLSKDDSVVVGPGIGEDAAVIDTGKRLIAVKTDPITFTSQNIGWYVVNINANDIACMGATPRWMLVTLLLPPEEKSDFLHHFFTEISESCKDLGVHLIGGHTEVTPAVKKPVAIGCMIGCLLGERVINNSGAKPGDVVLLTKGLAIEGTHVIYQEKKGELENKISSPILKRIEGFLKDPGISVVREATLAAANADVHCMHDPTEGGLVAGLWEIATASEVGIKIKKESVPIFKETKLVCKEFNLDPLSLLASGALLIVANPKDAEKLISLYKDAGISCTKIGKIVPKKEKVSITTEKGEIFYITEPPKDELNKLFKEG